MSNTAHLVEESPWVFGLGDRLAKALTVAKISNADMAAYLGVSANTVGNYIAGRTNPQLPTIREWAVRTGAPLEWLHHTGDETAERDQLRADRTPPNARGLSLRQPRQRFRARSLLREMSIDDLARRSRHDGVVAA